MNKAYIKKRPKQCKRFFEQGKSKYMFLSTILDIIKRILGHASLRLDLPGNDPRPSYILFSLAVPSPIIITCNMD
jgi:hypothetical protein